MRERDGMNYRVVLAVLIGLVSIVLAGSAAAAGPRSALGPTISIPLPAEGKAGFAVITVTGTLVLGTTDPALVLGRAPDPSKLPRTVRAAGGGTKPTTTRGTTTVQFYVWIGNQGTASGTNTSDTLKLAVIGRHAVWAAGPLVRQSSIDCRTLKKLRYTTYFTFLGTASAHDTLVKALKTARCA